MSLGYGLKVRVMVGTRSELGLGHVRFGLGLSIAKMEMMLVMQSTNTTCQCRLATGGRGFAIMGDMGDRSPSKFRTREKSPTIFIGGHPPFF